MENFYSCIYDILFIKDKFYYEYLLLKTFKLTAAASVMIMHNTALSFHYKRENSLN